MIIFDHPDRFAQFHQSCVATIGKFDGVHLGHQLILDQLKQRAEELNLPTLVILLEPHPEEFLQGLRANHRPVSMWSEKSWNCWKVSGSILYFS